MTIPNVPEQERIDRDTAALLLATRLMKKAEPARTCDLFDAETCPFCDHYEECAAQESEK